jgi:HK97 family phage prohead protease
MLEYVTKRAELTADPSTYVLSDGDPDRMGDIVDPRGWELSTFAPKALLNHNRDWIVGKWDGVKVQGDQLVGRLQLAEEDTSPVTKMVHALIRQGLLDEVSVGFRALKREPIDKADPLGPQRFLKMELLEASLVSIPANPRARRVAKQFLSDDQVTRLFAKPGENEGGRSSPTGKLPDPARRLNSRSTPMQTGTLSQRIQAAQETFKGLRDRLTELTTRDVTEDEAQRADELPDEIEVARKELERLERQERALSMPLNGGSSLVVREPQGEVKQAEIFEPRKPFPLVGTRKKPEPDEYIYRGLTAWSHMVGAHEPSLNQIVRERYRGDDLTEAMSNYLVKSSVAGAMTNVAGWAQELVVQSNQGFLDRLLPESIYQALSGAGVKYTFGPGAGTIKIPTRTTSQTLAGAWVGEAAPKPVKRASFSSVTLTPFKLAVISVFSEEMALYSTPSIEGIIRQAMSDNTSIALDSFLIDAVAASATRPAGLLNGVTPLTATAAGTTTEKMIADLKQLKAAIIAAGGGRNIIFLINPAQGMAFDFALTTTGDFLFSGSEEASAKIRGRFIESLTVPAGRVIAVDAADFATATGDTPRFNVSNEATLHMEDTTPLAIGTAGSPATVAAPTQSLFQTDCIAIRLSLYVTWQMRRTGMVQTIASVGW